VKGTRDKAQGTRKPQATRYKEGTRTKSGIRHPASGIRHPVSSITIANNYRYDKELFQNRLAEPDEE